MIPLSSVLIHSIDVDKLAQLCMSIVILSYGAKLIRKKSVSGPDLYSFIIYQLTLGGILSVSDESTSFFFRKKKEMDMSRIFRRSTVH